MGFLFFHNLGNKTATRLLRLMAFLLLLTKVPLFDIIESQKRCPTTEKGGTLKKVSHYLYTKGEALK